MGDVRFTRVLEGLRSAPDRVEAIRRMDVDDLVMALAATSPEREPLLVNVLATELQNRTRRGRAALDHVAEAIVTTGTHGEVNMINRAAERLLGLSAGEAVGHSVLEVVPLLDAEGARVTSAQRPFARVLATGAPAERNDLLLARRDGRRTPVALLAAPIRAEGEVIGVVLSLRDATRQRAYEDDLLFHKRLLEAVGEAVIGTRPDGTILYWNQAAERLYGWPAREVLGHSVVEVTPSEASREDAEQIMDHMRRGQPWSGVFPVRRRDGSTFVARVTNAPVLDGRGRLVAMIGLSHAEAPQDQRSSAITR